MAFHEVMVFSTYPMVMIAEIYAVRATRTNPRLLSPRVRVFVCVAAVMVLKQDRLDCGQYKPERHSADVPKVMVGKQTQCKIMQGADCMRGYRSRLFLPLDSSLRRCEHISRSWLKQNE